MATPHSSPAEDIEQLIRIPSSGPTPRKRTVATFENIKQACDKLAELKAPITAAAVASITSSLRNGPAYGSIRNNKLFGGYISARGAEQTGKAGNDSWLSPANLSGDVQTNAKFAALAAVNKALQRKVAALGQLLRNLGVFDFAALAERGELISLGDLKISPAARSALVAALDPERLASVGLSVTEGGQISNARLKKVFLFKAEVDALKSLLQPTEKNPPKTGRAKEMKNGAPGALGR